MGFTSAHGEGGDFGSSSMQGLIHTQFSDNLGEKMGNYQQQRGSFQLQAMEEAGQAGWAISSLQFGSGKVGLGELEGGSPFLLMPRGA